MNRARLGKSVRIGFAVLLALLALPGSTRQASAQEAPSVYIAPTGLVDGGLATVSGSVLMPDIVWDFDIVAVHVTLEQRLNGKLTVGNGGFQGSVSFLSTSVPWSITIAPKAAAFKAGHITVRVQAESETFGLSEEVTRQVLLRPR